MNLKDYNLKHTKARKLILNIFNENNKALTAEEIYEKVKDNSINLSTVYRTLQTFSDSNIINKELRKDGTYIYFLKTKVHHHVLICNVCKKRIDIDTCPFEKILTQIQFKTGFKVNDLNLELYGTCIECQKNGGAR
jgi:Fur family ferric uptake transcriptional regulator